MKIKKLDDLKIEQFKNADICEFWNCNSEFSLFTRFNINKDKIIILYFNMKKENDVFYIDKILISDNEKKIELKSQSKEFAKKIYNQCNQIQNKIKVIESEHQDHLKRLENREVNFYDINEFRKYVDDNNLINFDIDENLKNKVIKSIYYGDFYDDMNFVPEIDIIYISMFNRSSYIFNRELERSKRLNKNSVFIVKDQDNNSIKGSKTILIYPNHLRDIAKKSKKRMMYISDAEFIKNFNSEEIISLD